VLERDGWRCQHCVLRGKIQAGWLASLEKVEPWREAPHSYIGRARAPYQVCQSGIAIKGRVILGQQFQKNMLALSCRRSRIFN
jgi:hypothetical protein